MRDLLGNEMKETKLKPFVLSEALEGKPVITRDGREVTQLHLFKTCEKYPLFGVIDNKVYAFANNGIFDFKTCNSIYDLFMAPIKTKYWVYVYTNESGGLESVVSCRLFTGKGWLHTSEFEIDE